MDKNGGKEHQNGHPALSTGGGGAQPRSSQPSLDGPRADDEPEPPDSGSRHDAPQPTQPAGAVLPQEQQGGHPRSRSLTLESKTGLTATSSGASSPVATFIVGHDKQGPIDLEAQLKHRGADDRGSVASSTATPSVLQPHTLTFDDCLAHLKSNPTTGLSSADATDRLARDGPNTIREAKGVSVLDILIRQVANALTIILLAAMALSFGVRDWVEGAVVAAVILINTLIGFIQEYKAEKTMASLRSLSAPTAQVLRDSRIVELPARDLVLGDIIVFVTGDLLPADVRLIEPMSNLEIDEASLTGESLPVAKVLDALDGKDLGPADRINLGYAGTVVTKGRGRGVVVAVAGDTQLGTIAAAMDSRAERKAANSALPFYKRAWIVVSRFLGLRDGTPLQRKLAWFALVLLALAILCIIIVFAVATFDLNDQVILYAVALAIGVLPESLLAVLAITFAAGAKRMAQGGVIVRRLEALEALGGVDCVCSDKTGTLTLGSMVVRELWAPCSNSGTSFSIDHTGATALEPVGSIHRLSSPDSVGKADMANITLDGTPTEVSTLVLAASLCNIAEIHQASDGKWSGRGDPTELALQVLAHKLATGRPSLTEGDSPAYTLEQEHPFDSSTKRMTSMYSLASDAASYTLFMKGGVDQVLDTCTSIRLDEHGSIVALDEKKRALINKTMEKMAAQGLRVLAFAQRKVSKERVSRADPEKQSLEARRELMSRKEAEQDFTFVGLAALYDPPRPETADAVAVCHQAGVMVICATGDHPATAKAIALSVGILKPDAPASAVMTAAQFDKLDEAAIDALPSLPLVVARCTPATKVRIINAARRRGLRMAMTGDGVNDAPALTQADVGVAMGSGTDIAKDSAELIITDDNFASLTTGIKQGRTVFKSIQKFMIALLCLNVAETLLLLIGLALRDDSPEPESIFPLSPLSILLLNLIVGLPAIGLGFEHPEADTMRRPPQKTGVFSRQVLVDLFVYGTVMGLLDLAVFFAMIYGFGQGQLGIHCNETPSDICDGVFEARSATFTTLFLQSLLIAWELLSVERSLFERGTLQRLKSNPFLTWTVIGAAVIALPICLYVPGWNDILKQAPMGRGWAATVVGVVLFLLFVDLWKWTARRGAWPWLTRITGGDLEFKRTLSDLPHADDALSDRCIV
ncbi:related to ca2-transporting atpase [Ceraceosorus bombacis]|uniref:P-type Na(+) transporter n=1 Tax=Ceraceosorus bombacis TaxID=401625 RepID=A0A0P1B906_9BASI|nr:related to ca2-transporting atpase [Ceraceosorus bombacis]